MLTELNTQLNIDKELTGQPAIWRDVYYTMRCSGPPYDKGPHCWYDPVGKKHYPLRPRHFKSLIRFVEQGGILETHRDVPEEIRQQLYAEEQFSLNTKRQKASTSVANLPPIHITNTMLTSSCQNCQQRPSSVLETPPPNSRLSIPGFRDRAVIRGILCLAPIEVRGPNTQSRVSEGSRYNKRERYDLVTNPSRSKSRLLNYGRR